MLMHSQGAFLFLFSIICYLFRLYLIVDHTHFLRTPYLFPIICVVIEFFFSLVTSVAFHIGYSEFEPNSLPFNLSHEQLDYMSMRTVVSYRMKTIKEIVFPVYSALLLLLAGVLIVLTAFEIRSCILLHLSDSLLVTFKQGVILLQGPRPLSSNLIILLLFHMELHAELVAICVYLFRLYLLVDHTHLLRMPNVFPAVSIVIVILNVMVSTILFVIGYSEFDPKTLSLNLTWEQLDYLYSKTVVSYRIRSFQEAVYPIYLGADIIISALISVLIIYNTVHHIKKKQSLMSAGATKHHLRVLRILTIQTLSMLGISCVAPFAVGLTLLIDVHSYIVTFSLIVLGFNSVVNSLLTLFFNPVLKRTILTFPKSKSTALRSSVFLVESVYK
ncbi:unnamed protein product [Auanema sp. JU1783]|nr:unnamed protein product [Auanema sp. JU1783]